ncbi:hypothetical protein GW17_00023255 [Ensete ventricosum]|nr:hypothetical protein GW17_00023255 [Ensete ventricosum]
MVPREDHATATNRALSLPTCRAADSNTLPRPPSHARWKSSNCRHPCPTDRPTQKRIAVSSEQRARVRGSRSFRPIKDLGSRGSSGSAHMGQVPTPKVQLDGSDYIKRQMESISTAPRWSRRADGSRARSKPVGRFRGHWAPPPLRLDKRLPDQTLHQPPSYTRTQLVASPSRGPRPRAQAKTGSNPH